jgi:glycosyltransferase involved in cell wall biosynthesis
MCLVSIIVPTYNRAHLIDISVNSILNQTLRDFELLIIDDGSTDNTREKVLSFNDERIRYIYKKNSGVASTRNVGINAAEGEYIAFLDDDDSWPKNFLERMVGGLRERKEFGLAYCRHKVKIGGGAVKTTDLALCVSGSVTVNLFRNSFILPSTCVIVRKALGGTRFDETMETSEDSDFFLRFSVHTKYLFMDDLIVEKNETPKSLANRVNCNRIRSLERFYSMLGGKNLITLKIANKKFSKSYRRTALKYMKLRNYKAASYLLLRAIRFYPYYFNFYFEYMYVKILSFFISLDWQMPEPLGVPIVSN